MSAVQSNRVADLLKKRNQNRYDNRVVLTDEQVAKMRGEEPSEPQVKLLKENGVKMKEIDQMTKYDASERIEKILADLEKAPATQARIDGLVKLGWSEDDLKGITNGEASQLFASIPKRK